MWLNISLKNSEEVQGTNEDERIDTDKPETREAEI